MNTITVVVGIKICFYESHKKLRNVFFYDCIIKLMKNYTAKIHKNKSDITIYERDDTVM